MAKLTPNQREYRRQIARIRKVVQRQEKQGYYLQEPLYREAPSRITQKYLRELQQVTAKTYQARAVYVNHEGEVVSTALEESKRRRSEAAKKGAETRRQKAREEQPKAITAPEPEPVGYTADMYNQTIIANFYQRLQQYNELFYNRMVMWIDRLIARNGIEDVAQMLVDGESAGLLVTYRMAYDEEEMQGYMSDMLNYLPQAGATDRDEIEEIINSM